MPIGSIAEIPFRSRPLHELLHLPELPEPPELIEPGHELRPTVDLDYAGFGHARAPALELEGGDGSVQTVRDALVIAVHHLDDGEPAVGDLELGFAIDGDGDPYTVPVRLSDFLRVWLPVIRGDEAAIVLVACNPHRTRLPQPPGAGTTPVHYSLGDVDSWIHESPEQRVTLRLVAAAWRTAE